MKSLLLMTTTLWKNFFRNRQAIFFTLIFPLVFLLIFGFMYAEQATGPRDILVAVFIEDPSEGREILSNILEFTPGLSLNYLEVKGEVEKTVADRGAHFGITLEDSDLTFYFNPLLIQQNPQLEQMARGIKSGFEREKAGVQEVIKVEREAISTGTGEVSPLEYIFPGAIAIAVVSSGLFAITGFYLTFLETGVLRRMAATPLKKEVFFLSLILTRVVVAILGAFLILVAGRVLFRLSFEINWVLFLPYLVVGTLLMMALGVVITLVFRKRENANQFSGFLVTLMIFFSGIYIPLELLPGYLQTIGRFLPLTHVAQGLRGTMGIEPLVISEFWVSFLGMLGISIGLLLLVSWRSKWGEKTA